MMTVRQLVCFALTFIPIIRISVASQLLKFYFKHIKGFAMKFTNLLIAISLSLTSFSVMAGMGEVEGNTTCTEI